MVTVPTMARAFSTSTAPFRGTAGEGTPGSRSAVIYFLSGTRTALPPI